MMGERNGGGPGGRPFSVDDMMAVAWFLRWAERERQFSGGFSAAHKQIERRHRVKKEPK